MILKMLKAVLTLSKSHSSMPNQTLFKVLNPSFRPLVHVADPRVLYSEPAKFVAKLRATKTDNNLLLFKCELGAGHFSKSGR